MSWLASISSAFGGAPAASANSGNPAPQGNSNAPAPSPAPAPDASKAPAGDTQNNQSNNNPDPSAMFAKMWDNANKQVDAPPSLKMDDKILGEVAGSLDFMKSAPPELVQKALKGDVESLMGLLAHQGREIYATTMRHSAAVTDAFGAQQTKYQQDKFSQGVRKELTMSNLFEGMEGKVPDFAKSQLTDIATRFQSANPDASPAEVRAAVKDYVNMIAGIANPSKSNASSQANQEGTDWDAWASQ